MSDRQIWQDKIVADILNSDDGKYVKSYTLPRGSGVSTLFIRIIKEFNIIFQDEDVKILMIVPTKNHKRYVKSFVTSSSTQMIEKIAAFTGQALPELNQVEIIAADEDPHLIMRKYSSHVDWLLVDGVDEDSAVFSYIKELNINNSLIIRTI